MPVFVAQCARIFTSWPAVVMSIVNVLRRQRVSIRKGSSGVSMVDLDKAAAAFQIPCGASAPGGYCRVADILVPEWCSGCQQMLLCICRAFSLPCLLLRAQAPLPLRPHSFSAPQATVYVYQLVDNVVKVEKIDYQKPGAPASL